jgi:DNA helicase-2/ATP-dependent DNA helicase PcrA
MGTASSSPAGTVGNIVQQGQLIEHERFGLGEVIPVFLCFYGKESEEDERL